MISGTNAKIRLVRCPRCWRILPELPDFPVYKCGGCGTHLQAKIRKENAKSTTSGVPETDAAENKLDHAFKATESSSSDHEAIPHSVGECSLAQINGRDQIESGNCSGDKLTGTGVSNDDQKSESDKNETTVCDNEQGRGVSSTNKDDNNCSHQNESLACNIEDCNNCSHQNDSLACNIQQHGIPNGDCSSNELAHLENGKLSQFPLSEANSEEVNDGSFQSAPEAEAEAEADASNENNSTFRISSQEELVDSKGSTSFAAAHRLRGESISSDMLISSSNELLELPQGTAHHGFDGFRSTDTFETTDFVNPSSELSGTLIDLSKSPTTRSSRAYYEDDISSYEETDQLPDRQKHSSRHAYRLAKYAPSDVRPRRERLPVNGNHEMQHHFNNSMSILPENTHYAIKAGKLDQNELPEPTRLGHPVGNWRRSARDEFLPRHPFHRTESLAGYESGRPSNPSEFYYTSSFPSQDKPVYTEQKKMKLLRMVYELQDQLNKASLNDKANGGMTWKDQHIPMYRNHEVLQEENFHNLNYPRYPGRLREGSNWPQQRKYSRIPFSAEAKTGRHQVDHSSCCCPQEWQYPSQLPPPGIRHNKGLCRVHPHPNLYNSYSSCPSSPQQHMDSEFPIYSCGTKSHNQKHRIHEMKRYLREKHHLAKRHLRPVAGGAPFITCSSCLKSLQLPADFLLFKSRCHRLRCGACSEVLKFSLVSRTRLIPYMPTAEAPPPSEVDEYSGAIHRRNFTSTSHVSDCPCPDSVSGSDDCGLSFCKSSSIGRDPVSQTPYHAIHGNGVDRNGLCGSVEQSKERRNSISNETRNKGKNPVEIYESAGPSSSTSKPKKVSSEIEELPVAGGGGSPLHRLMGYSSPSQVIYGQGHMYHG